MEPQHRPLRLQVREAHIRTLGVDSYECGIPVHAHVGRDPHLAGRRGEFPAQVDSDRAHRTPRQANIGYGGNPLAAIILDLEERGLNRRRLGLRSRDNAARGRPIHPSSQEQHGVIRVERGKVERQGMALGAVLVVALEHRVGPVARQDACQDILPAVIDGGIRGDRGLDAEQLEVREWRSLGLLVGDDADPFGVIDCNQPHLIDIGRLAQFLGQAHVEVTVAHLQLVPPDRHVLVVIDREVNTSCQASPERRNA